DEKKGSISDDMSDDPEVKREKLIYFYGPEDNLEREMQLLANSAANQGFGMSTNSLKERPQDRDKDMSLGIPPIITHTAATPQGSPNATLEPSRSFPSSPLSLHIQAASLCSINQTFENASPPRSANNVASLSVPSSHFLPAFLQRRRSSCSSATFNVDSATSAPNSRRSSCLSTTGAGSDTVIRIQRRGSNISRKSSSNNHKKKSDKQTLVDDNESSDSDNNDNVSDRRPRRQSTTEADVNNQCNGDVSALCGSVGRTAQYRRSISSTTAATTRRPSAADKRHNSIGCHSPAVSPDDSVASFLSLERKNSLIHEIRVLSPRNSLTGVFYSSSVISVRNNSAGGNQSGLTSGSSAFKLDELPLQLAEPKIPPWSAEREFLGVANYVFTVIFAMEMLVKVTAKGLWYGRDAYFKNGWNIMDGILVGVSLFDI
ncbi:unnamed protein product, partial [Oppiella nova]